MSALGRCGSEGSEFVFRWHDGRLEARWAEAPEWQPWARFEQLGGDSYRTVFGRERGELLQSVRGAEAKVTRLYWATYRSRANRKYSAASSIRTAAPRAR